MNRKFEPQEVCFAIVHDTLRFVKVKQWIAEAKHENGRTVETEKYVVEYIDNPPNGGLQTSTAVILPQAMSGTLNFQKHELLESYEQNSPAAQGIFARGKKTNKETNEV